jgi:hypothetical protein
MGGVVKSITKPFKSVTKTVSNVVKKTAKAITKVGKSVMKGVAKISNKLGPVGMIALSIAMPYALAGLGNITAGWAAQQGTLSTFNTFLKSVGQVAQNIKFGYNSFNAKIAEGFSSITKTIGDAFTKFAPEGVKNMYSSISQGAKNLYTSAQEAVNKYMPKPFTAKAGTVDVYGTGSSVASDPGIAIISNTDAAAAIQRGTLSASELGKQTIGQTGLFTSANQADKIVSETINKAYAERLQNFGPNATRMFNDVKSYSEKMGTYVNDYEIGSAIENNIAANRYTVPIEPGKYSVNTDISDLTKTKDYISLNEEGTELLFTGNETFNSPPVKSTFDKIRDKAKDKIVNAGKGYIGSLLSPGTTPTPQQPSYYAGATSNDGFEGTGYGGTDVKGTAGGNLVAQVFGEQAANRISNYYRNMNILSSVG